MQDRGIKKQVKKHWSRLNREIEKGCVQGEFWLECHFPRNITTPASSARWKTQDAATARDPEGEVEYDEWSRIHSKNLLMFSHELLSISELSNLTHHSEAKKPHLTEGEFVGPPDQPNPSLLQTGVHQWAWRPPMCFDVLGR
jgi:hypothetical protein